MEAPFLPPVSAGLFWRLVFAVCPRRASSCRWNRGPVGSTSLPGGRGRNQRPRLEGKSNHEESIGGHFFVALLNAASMRRGLGCPCSFIRQLELKGEKLLHRLDRCFMRSFI